MKKLRLIAMFALTFALVFGIASCKTEEDEGPWGESLAEVLKNEPKLDLSGKWKAVDADLSGDVEGEQSYYYAYMKGELVAYDYLPDDQRIEMIACDFLNFSTDYDSTGNEFAESLVAKEEASKKPVDKEDYTKYNVLINGDRNEIRVEFDSFFTEGSGKEKATVTANGYVTYAKQKK